MKDEPRERVRCVIRFDFASGARRYDALGGLAESPMHAILYHHLEDAETRLRSLKDIHRDKPPEQWRIVYRVQETCLWAPIRVQPALG